MWRDKWGLGKRDVFVTVGEPGDACGIASSASAASGSDITLQTGCDISEVDCRHVCATMFS